ncbi:MAG: 1-acyl-sn-glycerol-3-phosphate acyltransferase [Nitrospirae bacterium]|nr:1-acyl-sn-glycerol-3-phosphate acyltransferase [Nitrospirota bacterium]
MSFSYWFFRSLFLISFKLFFGFEVIGSKKIPETGGVIVVANHVSYLDPMVVGSAIKKRQATFMARHGLFKIPLIGLFVGSFSFPINRDNPQPSSIKEAVNRLKRGELIVMFPEGGRRRDRTVLDAKRGVGLIAAMSNATVVPAFVDGTDRALPTGAKFIKPAKIRVFFGDPIEIKEEKKDRDFQDKIGAAVIEALRSLKTKVKG